MNFPFKITVEKRVADAINERGIIVKVAGKKFKMLPTTLSQIADISAIVSTMTDTSDIPDNIERNIDAYGEVFKHGINALHQAEVASVLLFRDEDIREQYHDFITQNLTQEEFKPIYNFMLESIDAGFFLTSTIILKGINQMAPTKTTPHS
ncbi:MAG: hypothetical protein EGP82_00265 [Odoribacter splanchnicus]|nr:hypothetical protein [Odoribacter splanchnicus]